MSNTKKILAGLLAMGAVLFATFMPVYEREERARYTVIVPSGGTNMLGWTNVYIVHDYSTSAEILTSDGRTVIIHGPMVFIKTK